MYNECIIVLVIISRSPLLNVTDSSGFTSVEVSDIGRKSVSIDQGGWVLGSGSTLASLQRCGSIHPLWWRHWTSRTRVQTVLCRTHVRSTLVGLLLVSSLCNKNNVLNTCYLWIYLPFSHWSVDNYKIILIFVTLCVQTSFFLKVPILSTLTLHT